MSKGSRVRIGMSVVLLSFTGLSVVAVSATEEAEGEVLFLKYKCTACHSVEVASVNADQKDKGPDLSAASSEIETPEWAKEYLLRKIEKDGKKHRKPYKGSEEDLETIIEWLMGLKSSS